MARAELEQSWIGEGEWESIQGILVGVLSQHKMRCQCDSEARITAKQGSQILTRLLGGWFVPARWLPKRVEIRLRRAADGDGFRIRALFEETLGFGVLDSILKKKYERYFAKIVAELREATGGEEPELNETV